MTSNMKIPKAADLPLLTPEQWEELCDGCGRCCLVKLEDEDSGEILYTSVACRYLDTESCRCTEYTKRTSLVADCIQLDARRLDALPWLPATCAYRLLASGKALPSWHPRLTGRADSVHEAGISVRSFAISETELTEAHELEDFVLWPDDDETAG